MKSNKIKQRAMHGVSFLLFREMGMKILAILGQIVLVRLLLPQIFGVFALITFIVSIAQLFTDLGLSSAIIQRKYITTIQLTTIFYVKLLLAILIFTILIIMAQFIPLIYHELGINEILMTRVMAIILLITPIESMQTSLLERKFLYSKISIIDVMGILVYYVAAIVFAFIGFAVWSFVIATILKEISEALVAYYFCRWKPNNILNVTSVKKIIKYGSYLQAGSIIAFIQQSIVPVIAGIKTSSYQVGLLSWSQNSASLPRILPYNVGRIAFTSFSRIQNDKVTIGYSVGKSFKLMNMITIPFIAIILGFGQEIIHYLLTDKWLAALPALDWFIVGMFFVNGTAMLEQAFIALGHSRLMFLVSTLLVGLEWILSFILLGIFGFTGIAIGSFVGVVLMFITYTFLASHFNLKIKMFRIALSALPLVVFIILAIIVLNFIFYSSFYFLIIKLLLFFLVYIAFCFYYEKEEINTLRVLIKYSRNNLASKNTL